jgi:hypothetical protein
MLFSIPDLPSFTPAPFFTSTGPPNPTSMHHTHR